MNNELVKLPECLKGVKFERQQINVYKLNTNEKLSVQREANLNRAKEIGQNWIEGFNHDPIVNIDTKTGIYNEPSGQHTTLGFMWRLENGLEDNAVIWCRVTKDLSQEQLNAIFAYEAIMEEPQKKSKVIEALWNSNNECLHNLSTLLNAYGYTIQCNKNGNYVIVCLETLLDIGIKDLDKVLEFSSVVFNIKRKIRINSKDKLVNKASVEATFLKGINLFLKIYGESIDIIKFNDYVNNDDSIYADKIKLEAKMMNNIDGKMKSVKQVAYALVKTYNKKARGKNKLSEIPIMEYFENN